MARCREPSEPGSAELARTVVHVAPMLTVHRGAPRSSCTARSRWYRNVNTTRLSSSSPTAARRIRCSVSATQRLPCGSTRSGSGCTAPACSLPPASTWSSGTMPPRVPDPMTYHEASQLCHLLAMPPDRLRALCGLLDPEGIRHATRILPVGLDRFGLVFRAETPTGARRLRLPSSPRCTGSRNCTMRCEPCFAAPSRTARPSRRPTAARPVRGSRWAGPAEVEV